MTPGIPEGATPAQWRAALNAAQDALQAATGVTWTVDEWQGYGDLGEDGWTWPVYAGHDGDLGHGVADAGHAGWMEYLLLQAEEGREQCIHCHADSWDWARDGHGAPYCRPCIERLGLEVED